MSRDMSSIDVGADSSPVWNGTATNPIDLTSSPEPAHATLGPSCGGHEPDRDAAGGGTAWPDSFFNRKSDVRLSNLSFSDRYAVAARNGALTLTDSENILLLAAELTNDELMNSTDIGNPSRNRSKGKKSRDIIKSAISQVAQHFNVDPQQVEKALKQAKKASGAAQRKNELARTRKHATMKKNEAGGRKYNAQNATKSVSTRPITQPTTGPVIIPLTRLPPSGTFAFPFPVPHPSVSLWRTKDYQKPQVHTHRGPLLISEPSHSLLDDFGVNPPRQRQNPSAGLIRFQPSRRPGQQSMAWLKNAQHLREFERLPASQHLAASQALTPGTTTQDEEDQAESRRQKTLPKVIELDSGNDTDEENGEDGGNLAPNEESEETGLALIDDVDGPDASDQESSNEVDQDAHNEDDDSMAADQMSTELESELVDEADGPLQEEASIPEGRGCCFDTAQDGW